MNTSQITRSGLALLIALAGMPLASALAQSAPYGMPYQQGAAPYAQQTYPAPQTYAPQYMAMMQQANGQGTYNPSLESVAPGPMQQPMPMPAAANAQQPPMNMASSAPCNCQPQAGYESYSSGCATGDCGVGYNSFASGMAPGCYAAGNVCYSGCGGCGMNRGPRRRWFGGVYGLYMTLEEGDCIPLAFQTTTPAVGYYPTDGEIILSTKDVDDDDFAGAEVRFGATIAACDGCGYGSCGSGCGCGNGCGQLAWEVGYWGLFRETSTAIVTDASTFGTDGNRTYGMIDFRGLESNPSGVYRPVNHYFDFGPPTTDNTVPTDIEIRQFTARRTFQMQNLELNLLRLPLVGGGCGSCGGGCCNSGGCGVGGYAFSGQRCQVSTLMGVRYMRIDDDFMLRNDWQDMGTFATGWHRYNVEVDNELIGFQLGANGAYYLGPCGRFALQCGANAGIYGNRATVWQWMDESAGMTRYVNGTQADFAHEYDNTDVAFLGEMRLGASYQISCNCRLYGGYRVLGMTGVAVSYDQIPGNSAYATPGQVSIVDHGGSYFLHGVQTGIEFMY